MFFFCILDGREMTTINYQLSSRQCMRWTVGLNSAATCEQKFPEAVNVIEPVQHQGKPGVGRISLFCLVSVSMPCSFRSFQSQSISRKLLLRYFHCLLTSFWLLQQNAILRERLSVGLQFDADTSLLCQTFDNGMPFLVIFSDGSGNVLYPFLIDYLISIYS